MTLKKLLKFSIKNYLIVAFIAIVAFVGLVSAYKIFFSEPTYVYAKVKVGQGFWWANTGKPNVWLINSVKKGDKGYSLLGKPEVEVLSVRYYPFWGGSNFDIYLTLKIKANYNKRTKTYAFQRSTLSIGSPIEIQFPSADVTGTIISISKKPFNGSRKWRIVYLVNPGGYTKDFPYRFENVNIGDKYFDGEEYTFEVLDKKLEKNIWSIANNLNAQVYEREITTTQNIVVKARIKVLEKDSQLYFGEEHRVIINSGVPIATPNFFFEGFAVRKIE